MARTLSVLISGAGIAGPTLAFWLERAGFVPTLLEAAPIPRTGGYMIDFWGSGFDVASRMGLEPRLRDVGYEVSALRVVDGRGRRRVRLRMQELSRALRGRYCSLLRADLAEMLQSSVAHSVERVFGDEVYRLHQRDRKVDVYFASGRNRTFDLVIGADGVHSNVRELGFDTVQGFERPLNYWVAAFTSTGYPRIDPHEYVSRTGLGRQVARFTLRDGRTVFFMFLAGELANGYDLGTPVSQRAFLKDALAGLWPSEEGDIAQALTRADDLYFDAVSQVRVPRWSRGRIALVGDAAFGPSLLAGEGASLAMTGAYVLAGELATAPYAEAFASYERRLRPLMERKQRSAARFGAWFAPRTRLGLAVRNFLTRIAAIPPLTARLVAPMVADRFELPDYRWPVTRLRALDGGRQ